MATLADFVTAVGLRVPDDAGRLAAISTSIGVTDIRADRVLSAVRTYSRARPLEADEIITGDGSRQIHAAPRHWQHNFSVLADLEIPVDLVPAQMVRPVKDQLVVIRREGLDWIGTVRRTLSLGEVARVHYHTAHRVTLISEGGENTIPDNDFDAVVDLAASMCCETLATWYAESTNSTITADNVGQLEKAGLFGTLAETYQRRYTSHMAPLIDADGEAAIVMHDTDMPNYRGPLSDYLFAKRRLR